MFNILLLRSNLYGSKDCVVIPEFVLNSILTLCSKDVEYSGQLLLYKKIAEYPFLSGSGTLGSVYPKKKVVYNNSPDYSTIEFHTHTEGLGDSWTDRFSEGDLKTFNNRVLQEGDNYQHMLFTTKNILTWGAHMAPDLRIGFGNGDIILKTFYEINDRHKCWNTLQPNI